MARVFVALPEKSREVAGFYALSAGSIERATFPPEDVKRLPRYPVPVALIGRLAVDRRQAKAWARHSWRMRLSSYLTQLVARHYITIGSGVSPDCRPPA